MDKPTRSGTRTLTTAPKLVQQEDGVARGPPGCPAPPRQDPQTIHQNPYDVLDEEQGGVDTPTETPRRRHMNCHQQGGVDTPTEAPRRRHMDCHQQGGVETPTEAPRGSRPLQEERYKDRTCLNQALGQAGVPLYAESQAPSPMKTGSRSYGNIGGHGFQGCV